MEHGAFGGNLLLQPTIDYANHIPTHTHTVAHLERKHLLSEHARQQDTHDVRSEQRGVIQSYPIRYNLVQTANCFEELVRLFSGVCVCVFWCVG